MNLNKKYSHLNKSSFSLPLASHYCEDEHDDGGNNDEGGCCGAGDDGRAGIIDFSLFVGCGWKARSHTNVLTCVGR